MEYELRNLINIFEDIKTSNVLVEQLDSNGKVISSNVGEDKSTIQWIHPKPQATHIRLKMGTIHKYAQVYFKQGEQDFNFSFVNVCDGEILAIPEGTREVVITPVLKEDEDEICTADGDEMEEL
jgi:hypothetical protein